jgi:hypothetical protein
LKPYPTSDDELFLVLFVNVNTAFDLEALEGGYKKA